MLGPLNCRDLREEYARYKVLSRTKPDEYFIVSPDGADQSNHLLPKVRVYSCDGDHSSLKQMNTLAGPGKGNGLNFFHVLLYIAITPVDSIRW